VRFEAFLAPMRLITIRVFCSELALLALSADVACLEMLLEELRTLLFTVQERRHDTTTSASRSLDDSLAAINDKLETASMDLAALEDRFKEVSAPPGMLQSKLVEMKDALEGIYKDYDVRAVLTASVSDRLAASTGRVLGR
jgi:hypothetical protein